MQIPGQFCVEINTDWAIRNIKSDLKSIATALSEVTTVEKSLDLQWSARSSDFSTLLKAMSDEFKHASALLQGELRSALI